MIKPEILIICPSRKRPDKLEEAIKSWQDTTEGHSDFLVLLDEDNEDMYPRLEIKNLYYKVYPRMTVPKLVNTAMELVDNYKGFFSFGDDSIFRTPWESKMLEKLTPFSVVYGNDGNEVGVNGEDPLPTLFVAGTGIPKALGWFQYEKFNHLFVDVLLRDIWKLVEKECGKMQFYIPEILVEHMHVTVGKSKMDSIYNNHWNPQAYNADAQAYRSVTNEMKQELANKIIKAIHENE